MPVVKLETRLRNRRRAAQLRELHQNLEGDLETLRSTLGHALNEYEGTLSDALDVLPGWANVDRAQVRELFAITNLGEDVMLGPRAVALAAARVEVFVDAWLGRGLDPDDPLPLGSLERWSEDLAEVRVLLARVREESRGAAASAENTLGSKLDAVLASLEEAREEREEALLEEVERGNVAAGEAARKREAKLWEEQREKASVMRERWSPLEELVFIGIDSTIGGIDYLEGMVDAVADGMTQAFPDLDPKAARRGKRVRKITQPPPLPTRRQEGSPSSVVDDARRETEPLDVFRTEELEREVEALVTSDLLPLVDEPPPLPAVPPRTKPAPAPPAPARPVATDHPNIVYDEAVFRVVTGWQEVQRAEQLLVLAPPAVYTAFLFIWVLAYHVGIFDRNPFDAWNAALPLFLGCASCLFLLPAILGWRVEWSADWRPSVLRWQRKREDSVLRVAPDSLRLGESDVRWDLARGRMFRSGKVERYWYLELSERGRTVELGAPATDLGAWEACQDVTPPRKLAWHVSEETVLEIAHRVGALDASLNDSRR